MSKTSTILDSGWQDARLDFSSANQMAELANKNFSEVGTIFSQMRKDRLEEEKLKAERDFKNMEMMAKVRELALNAYEKDLDRQSTAEIHKLDRDNALAIANYKVDAAKKLKQLEWDREDKEKQDQMEKAAKFFDIASGNLTNRESAAKAEAQRLQLFPLQEKHRLVSDELRERENLLLEAQNNLTKLEELKKGYNADTFNNILQKEKEGVDYQLSAGYGLIGDLSPLTRKEQQYKDKYENLHKALNSGAFDKYKSAIDKTNLDAMSDLRKRREDLSQKIKETSTRIDKEYPITSIPDLRDPKQAMMLAYSMGLKDFGKAFALAYNTNLENAGRALVNLNNPKNTKGFNSNIGEKTITKSNARLVTNLKPKDRNTYVTAADYLYNELRSKNVLVTKDACLNAIIKMYPISEKSDFRKEIDENLLSDKSKNTTPWFENFDELEHIIKTNPKKLFDGNSETSKKFLTIMKGLQSNDPSMFLLLDDDNEGSYPFKND